MNKGLEVLARIKGHFNPKDIANKELFEEDFNTIEKELKAKKLVFDKLGIKVREIPYKDGRVKYLLCFNFLSSIEISKEEYDTLR